MAGKLAMKDVFRFDRAGSLERPGPMGRTVRLVLGLACLWVVWQLVTRSGLPDLVNPSFWVLAAFGLVLAPYVVNIGFGANLGAWPRVASVGLLALAAVVSFATAGSLLAAPLWATVVVWMVYVYGHLGLSFVLAAAIATPGCEMRSLPHLAGLVRRRDAREHYCPGFIQNVDAWERGRGGGAGDGETAGSATTARERRDFLRNASGQLLVYGLPFVLLQVAGNLGGFAVATGGAAFSFLFVGAACSANALRSGRVHCLFVGPWCLLAGTLMALYGFRQIDFGADTWALIANSGLAGAVVLYLASEKILGRYLGGR